MLYIFISLSAAFKLTSVFTTGLFAFPMKLDARLVHEGAEVDAVPNSVPAANAASVVYCSIKCSL